MLVAAGRILGVGQERLSELALSAPPGSDGLVLLPYLEGERTPNLPEATGELRGLRHRTSTPAHLARATIEGVLCSLADALDAVEERGVVINAVHLIGGGSRSEALRRIAPTIFARPVHVPPPGEYVATGAAFQARWALKGGAMPPAWTWEGSELFEAEAAPEVRARYGEVRDEYIAGARARPELTLVARRGFGSVPEMKATTRALSGLPARQQLLKQHNLALVLRQIANEDNLSRARLAVRTGLTKATVSTLVDALIEARLVTERDPERGLIGRPGSPLGRTPTGRPASASRSTSTTSRPVSSTSPEPCVEQHDRERQPSRAAGGRHERRPGWRGASMKGPSLQASALSASPSACRVWSTSTGSSTAPRTCAAWRESPWPRF